MYFVYITRLFVYLQYIAFVYLMCNDFVDLCVYKINLNLLWYNVIFILLCSLITKYLLNLKKLLKYKFCLGNTIQYSRRWHKLCILSILNRTIVLEIFWLDYWKGRSKSPTLPNLCKTILYVSAVADNEFYKLWKYQTVIAEFR